MRRKWIDKEDIVYSVQYNVFGVFLHGINQNKIKSYVQIAGDDNKNKIKLQKQNGNVLNSAWSETRLYAPYKEQQRMYGAILCFKECTLDFQIHFLLLPDTLYSPNKEHSAINCIFLTFRESQTEIQCGLVMVKLAIFCVVLCFIICWWISCDQGFNFITNCCFSLQINGLKSIVCLLVYKARKRAFQKLGLKFSLDETKVFKVMLVT